MNNINGELMTAIANIILGTAFGIAMLLFGLGFLVAFILSKKSETRYKISVINIIKTKEGKENSEIAESINYAYKAYQNIKYGFSYLGIESLNIKLIGELRDNYYSKYYKDDINSLKVAESLERINKIIHDNLRHDDEKYKEVLKQIDLLTHNDSEKITAEKIKGQLNVFVGAIKSEFNGRIIEKELTIENYKRDLARERIKKFWCWLGWVIGLISGIITIISNI